MGLLIRIRARINNTNRERKEHNSYKFVKEKEKKKKREKKEKKKGHSGPIVKGICLMLLGVGDLRAEADGAELIFNLI